MSSAADPPLPPSQPLPSPPRMVLPRHIAVIVDGNRRWARQHRTHPAAAYRRGGERVHELLTWCQAAGIRAVTLWPLSADNLRRDPADVRALAQVITEVVCELADAGCWRLHLFGNPALLGDDARRRVRGAVRRTGRVSGMAVNIAVAYDGREDITAAVRSLLAEHAGRGTAVADIVDGLTSDQIARHLALTGQPPVDLIIRTSGEQRLSGFLPWQSAYSEFYFCDVNWPDFSRADFDAALLSYSRRSRRYGQ
ncbi:polyprenyl diphosphate synthase [Streptomyces sp. NPDC001502]|uniref:polyprenyl diphosphate synthase n=1 Tax=Streptomyces sp. NPDC001502 TaxID=3364578 RepID=UPI003677528A